VAQCRSWPFAFQHGELLAQSEHFERRIRSAAEEEPASGDQCKKQIIMKRPL